MAINTLITLKDALTAFADGHGQLQGRIIFEADDHREPYITVENTYPLLFVAPIDVTVGRAMNVHTLRVYVYERINDDREDVLENANDTSLILRDIRVWWNDYGTDDILIVDDPIGTFACDRELDNLVGYFSDIRFEIPSHGRCSVPVTVKPNPPTTCEDATYEITDTDLNVFYSGSISSGGNLDQVIQDSKAILKNTVDTILSITSILAEGSADIIAPDVKLHIKAEDDGTIANVTIPSGVNDEYIVDNNDISVNGVLEFDIHATHSLDVRLRDTSNGVVTPVSVTDSGNHATIVLPNTSLEVNGVSEGSVVAGSTVDVQLSDSGGTVTPDSVTLVGTDLQIVLPDAPPATPRSTATLMKTGQITSYRTGDDGDIEAGRLTNFLTLDSAPLHNDGSPTINTTTNRFTDTLGGQTYTNNIVLDWSTWNGSTLLGWYRIANASNVTWNTAIDSALSLSVGSFTTGWRLPNIMEFCSILNWGLTSYLNYAPFNLGSLAFQTSTTWAFTTTNNITIGPTGFLGISAKTNASGRFIGVRNFTVTGTTLT